MEIVERYLEYLRVQKDYKPKSLAAYRKYLYRAVEVSGKSLLELAQASEVEKVCIEAAKKRKITFNGGRKDDGQTYRRRMATNLSAFYRWAHRERLIPHNPYPEITFRKPKEREAEYFTDKELDRLLNNVDQITLFELVTIRILYETGMRREELCRVRLSNIDLHARSIHIPCGKGEKFRTVPFTEFTKSILELYLKGRAYYPGEHLLPGAKGGEMTPKTLGLMMQRLSRLMGFRVACHKFRHSCGRSWALAGVNQFLIMRMLGHSDPKMTAGYVHATSGDLRVLQEKVMAREDRVNSFPIGVVAKN